MSKTPNPASLKNIFILFVFVFLIRYSQAQNYPQDYFSNPLDIPIDLTANFGELRTNHFHMGLDIRTQQKENLPVHAAAEGYVSRVSVEKGGYGNAVYINHPNGYTTVYGHLNSFYPELADYVRTQQYATESWQQDITLPPGLFTVAKGRFIANSGNTGASEGPHLHFEIRDTKTENNLNPELFGFNIPDRIAPSIYSLYWYDRRFSTYISTPQPIAVTYKNGAYATTQNIIKVGSRLISFAIRGEDKNNMSSFRHGIYAASLYVDDLLQFAWRLDNFSYDITRYMNGCVDYPKWKSSHIGIQHLSVLPGNHLPVFAGTPSSKGVITLPDTSVHNVMITVTDAHKNTNNLAFKLQYNPAVQKDYSFPADATVCIPDNINLLQSNNSRLGFNDSAFYDAAPFVLQETALPGAPSPLIHLHTYLTPVHNEYTIWIRTTLAADDAQRNHAVLELNSGANQYISKGVWEGDWLKGYFKALGNAKITVDNLPPTLTPIGFVSGSSFAAKKTIVFRCTDNLDVISSFHAEIDNAWVPFAVHGNYFTYTIDNNFLPGEHELMVTVTDIAGNTVTKNYIIKR